MVGVFVNVRKVKGGVVFTSRARSSAGLSVVQATDVQGVFEHLLEVYNDEYPDQIDAVTGTVVKVSPDTKGKV